MLSSTAQLGQLTLDGAHITRPQHCGLPLTHQQVITRPILARGQNGNQVQHKPLVRRGQRQCISTQRGDRLSF